MYISNAEKCCRCSIVFHCITRSEEAGLNLIIETVNQDSPAYKSGVRQGDVIVTVDDWLITLMDRPQVSCQCPFCDASRLFL